MLAFAGTIRAEHVCFCSGVYGSGASNEQVRTVADALLAIGERAKEHGLAISIHNHVNSVVENEEDIARLLELLDPTLCALTLDTAHAAKAGIADVSSLIVRFHKHLLNVHLKDLDTDGQFCALGHGTLDIGKILKTLKSIIYNQWLIVDEETKSLDTETAFRIASECLRCESIFNAKV